MKKIKIIKKLKQIGQKMKLEQKRFNSIELLLVVIMALILGLLVGELVFSNKTSTPKINNSNSNEINKVYNTLIKEYYGEISEDKLTEAAIQGMIDLLKDKHSVYFDEEQSEDFQIRLTGKFIGMGAQITKDDKDNAIITSVFEKSPAEKAGLKVGDIFLKIDNSSVEKMTTTEITKKIKGIKKNVSLTIKRNNEEKTYKIKTGEVNIPSVISKIYEKSNKRIGYLYLSIFAQNADEQFEEKLLELENKKIDSLIIDLRDNPGGHLDTAKNIASEFLNKNQVICQIKSKNKIEKIYSDKNNQRKYKIIVLVNESSASGSEVLASALQEKYNATIIGTKTYGKGTVQKVLKLKDGSMIKYTIETWLTSNGNSINEKGITPNIVLKLNEKYYETADENDDNQLQEALEVLDK